MRYVGIDIASETHMHGRGRAASGLGAGSIAQGVRQAEVHDPRAPVGSH
jgi:hypothetical protein